MRLCACIVLAAAVSGCKKRHEEATGPALTADLVRHGRDIQIYTAEGTAETFPRALAKAKALLGEPTHVDGVKHQWAVIDGEVCVYYTLEDKGGTAASPGTASVPKDDPECRSAAGVTSAAAGSAT